MYAAAQRPVDAALDEKYGEIADIPGKILETFGNLFKGETAPNPQDVATAVNELVSMPAATRIALPHLDLAIGRTWRATSISRLAATR
jgi:hypothetical protein